MSYIKTSKGKFTFKQKLLYPGCHIINRDIAFENLVVLKKVLSSYNIFWEVAWGTLLGIVRDNDFIKWDEDIDIVILEEEEDQFKEILWNLKEHGFELIRYERGGLYSILRNGEYTDFYVLKKASNEIRYTLDGGYILEKHIKESIDMDFKGIQLSIPKDFDELLTFYYDDWRTPVKYFSTDLSPFERLKFKLNYWCRLYLPDFLYYRILKKRRKIGLNSFVEKIIGKGIEINEEPLIR